MLIKKTEPKESNPNALACLQQVPSAPQIFTALAKLALRASDIPRLIGKCPLHSSDGKGEENFLHPRVTQPEMDGGVVIRAADV